MLKRNCPRCEQPNDAAARFCTQCGASMITPVRCPACQQVSPQGGRYCQGCGTSLYEGFTGGSADGAVVEGEWQRGPDEFIRRVEPEDARGFLGSRVVRVPVGTLGVVLVGGVVQRLLPPGEQTSQTLFERIAGFFSGKGRTAALYLIDLRPIPVPFTVHTGSSSTGRSLQTQLLVSLRVPRGDRDGIAQFISSVLADRAAYAASDLYNLLRPEVTALATRILERLGQAGDVRFAEAEGELRRELGELIGRRYGLALDVTLAPLTNTANLSLVLGAGSGGTDATRRGLFCADGEQVEVDLILRVQGQHDDFSAERLEPALVATAAAHLRHATLAELVSADGFAQLERAVRGDAAAGLASYGLDLVSLSVLDVRSVTGQWLLSARAELKRAREELSVGREWLAHDVDEVQLAELAYAQALSRQRVERDAALARLGKELEAARGEQTLRRSDALARDREALSDRQGREDLADTAARLDVAEARRAAERDVEINDARHRVRAAERAERQADEIEAIQHGGAARRLAFEHDAAISREALDLDAQTHRQATALESERARRLAEDQAHALEARQRVELEAEEQRLRLRDELAEAEERRQLAKLAAMAELDRTAVAQDQAHERTMRELLKGLTDEEMIAAQATQLARSEGGGAAWAEALAGRGDARAAAQRAEDVSRHAAELREVMRAQAQDVQQVMREQLDRMSQLAGRALDSTLEARGDAAAVSLYERSMDSMSRVAASRAAPAPLAAVVGAETSERRGPSEEGGSCRGCGAPFAEGVKYCGRCGAATGPADRA